MKLRTEERGTETTAGSKLKEEDEGESKTKQNMEEVIKGKKSQRAKKGGIKE